MRIVVGTNYWNERVNQFDTTPAPRTLRAVAMALNERDMTELRTGYKGNKMEEIRDNWGTEKKNGNEE
jgi:hypothetical protein